MTSAGHAEADREHQGAGQGLQGRCGSGGLAVPGSTRLVPVPPGSGSAMRQGPTSKPRATSRPGHDQRAVKAKATLPRTRAGEPRASMRACSYHASPGPGQGNVLWIGLWMIYVKTLVNLSTAVDEGCCGKVDNRCDTGPCQVAALPRSTGRYEVSTGQLVGLCASLLWRCEVVTAVSVAMRKFRCSPRSATTG